MTPYRHQQLGGRLYFVSILIGVALAIAVGVALASSGAESGATQPVFCLGALLALVAAAFGRLTVSVGSGVSGKARLDWSMTFGWPGGTIPIDEIADAQIIPVTFRMGIGIHLTLRGWVWNVALGKGVQVRKRDGSNVVLGTDDAEELLAAIQNARAAAP